MNVEKEHRLLRLNELEELRNESYESARIYKEKNKRWYDSKILRKEFKVGEQVLLDKYRLNLFLRELILRWYELLMVISVFPYGAISL